MFNGENAKNAAGQNNLNIANRAKCAELRRLNSEDDRRRNDPYYPGAEFYVRARARVIDPTRRLF